MHTGLALTCDSMHASRGSMAPSELLQEGHACSKTEVVWGRPSSNSSRVLTRI